MGKDMSVADIYAIGAIEKFAFNGLRAMLILFLVSALKQGDQRAFETYSFILASAFVIPLLGSLATRMKVPELAVIQIGLAVGSAGFFLMLLGDSWVFEGLCLIVVGTGFARALISSTLGRLIRERNPENEQSAFSALYTWFNVGSFLGAIMLAGVGEKVAWGAAFLLGGLSLAAGAWLAGRSLPSTPLSRRGKVLALMLVSLVPVRLGFLLPIAWLDYIMGALCVAVPVAMLVLQWRSSRNLTSALTLFVLALGIFVFFGLYEHSATTINIFTDRFVDREVLGFRIPTTFFQALDPTFNIGLGVLMALLLSSRWGKGAIAKPTIRLNSGFAAMALAFLVFGLAYSTGTRSPMVLVIFYCGLVLSEVLFVPSALALVSSESAPDQRALQMALLYVMIGSSMWWSGKISSYFAPGDLQKLGSADFLALFSGLQLLSVAGCLGFAALFACAQWAPGLVRTKAGGR